MKNINYKHHIDGLRAISVISVVIYHTNLSFFNIKLTGGYLGVDIFFIISGYLISKILLNEYSTSRKIDILNFYQRRIRRILPAYLFVIFVVLIAANFFLLENQIKDLVNSVISSLLFFANYFFYFSGNSYADPEMMYRPLVHLWSLAVEEQFYLFFPLILIIFIRKKFKFNLLLFFILLFCIISSITTFFDQDFSFFSTSSRIFQLGLGILTALIEINFSKKLNKLHTYRLDIIAIFVLIFSFFIFNETTFHPSVLSLIPSIAAMILILVTNKNNLLFKILTFSPIKIIGLMSFSLYLWHYPIFSYARIAVLFPTSDKIFFTCFALIFFSLFSYFLIEKPFRNKKLFSNFRLNISIITLILINIFLCIFLYGKQINQDKNQILNKIAIEEKYINDNFKYEIYSIKNCANREKNFCSIIKDLKYKNVVFLGDSLTQQLIPEFVNRNLNVNIFDLTYSGMMYLPGYERKIKNKITASDSFHKNRKEFIENLDNSVIIIFGRYHHIKNSSNYREIKGKNIKTNFNNDIGDSLENLLKNKNTEIFLFYPSPEYEFNILNKIKQKFMFNRNKEYLDKNEISKQEIQFKNKNLDIFKSFDSINNLRLKKLYPHKYVCDEKRCYTHDGENLFYQDDVHFSQYIIKKINDELILKLKY